MLADRTTGTARFNFLEINKNTYLSYLRKANSGNLLPTNRLAGLELRLVSELINEGLLSDSKDRYLSGAETNKTVITPKGAVVLSDWERDLKEGRWWFKLGEALTRFLWVLVGVATTVIAKLLIT